jgi:hypothetical protein
MLAAPRSDLRPNTPDYERLPLVAPTGFREYDARWLFGPEINLLGIQALGLGLGTYLHERGVRPDIVTGHDFRSYSGAVKNCSDPRPYGVGLQGSRHRSGAVAHRLFRPGRARYSVPSPWSRRATTRTAGPA